MSAEHMSTAEIVELEDRHTSGVYPKRKLALSRGQGARVWDADGREYVDCVAGIGSGNVGHAHPKVVAAIQRQAAQLTLCAENVYNEQRARYEAKLTGAAPAHLRRVFLCNSGAEANEGCFKLARIATGRTKIVAAMRGFHGRTFGALSATWEKAYREPFEPLVPGFTHVPYDNLEKLAEVVDDQTAAVVLEVLQGEGGVRTGSAEFLQGAQQLCRERGAMFVLDEVQSGFGRTGKMFAFQHHGLEPDLVALAKSIAAGVPMGAVLIGDRVGELPQRVHGSTFGGNPLACAAAYAVLEVIEEEGLIERAARLGERFRSRISDLGSPHVREVRGMGLLVGVELKSKVAPVIDGLLEKGILALPAGPTVLRFLPPLVISEEDLDRVADATGEVLAQL